MKLVSQKKILIKFHFHYFFSFRWDVLNYCYKSTNENEKQSQIDAHYVSTTKIRENDQKSIKKVISRKGFTCLAICKHKLLIENC